MSYEILIQQGFWMHLSKEAISNPLCFTTSPEEPLITSGYDGTVRLWKLEDLDGLLKRGCRWLDDYLRNNGALNEDELSLKDFCRSAV
jgi:WD40 repeat protein